MRETSIRGPFMRYLKYFRSCGSCVIALALTGLGLPAIAQDKATLGGNHLSAIVVYANAHNGDVGAYKGRHFRVTGEFSHMDHSNDYAAGQRTDNARSFEIIVTSQVATPPGVDDIYVGCLLSKDHPYAKLADSFPLGQDPKEFSSSTFTLDGVIGDLDYEADAADAQLNLKRGCTVEKK